MAKHWAASRMLWVNAVAAALVALEANTGLLQPLLPFNFYTTLSVALPVINALLRVVTHQALCRHQPLNRP
ncbi:MAG: hypothetical protein LWW92_01090 [Rhodocyclales bacterium]|nr:hypothetical protein [Rhodocyclales bacterium]